MRCKNRRLGTAQRGGSPLQPSPGLCQAPTGEGRSAWAPRGGSWAQTNQQVLRPRLQTLATEQPSPSGPVRGEALGIIQGASILILCAPLCHPILRGGGCRGSCWAECQVSAPGGRGLASPLPSSDLPPVMQALESKEPREGQGDGLWQLLESGQGLDETPPQAGGPVASAGRG